MEKVKAQLTSISMERLVEKSYAAWNLHCESSVYSVAKNEEWDHFREGKRNESLLFI